MSTTVFALIVCSLALLPYAASAASFPRRVAEFDFKHAAVASFHQSFPGSTGPALCATSFYPFGTDEIIAVPSIAGVFSGAHANVSKLVEATWPNQADPVPKGTVKSAPDGASLVLTAGGFFVSPSKSTGAVSLLEVTSLQQSVKRQVISEPAKGFFYHEARWLDVNGDGLQDVIAARANKPMFGGKSRTNLVWLEQPGADALGKPWVERQLTNDIGPGVAFCMVNLDGDSKMPQIVAAQYFAKQELSIWWCDADLWSKCENGTGVHAITIDDSEKAPYFNVQWVDLNSDGKKELLATTNEANGKGSVLIYEVPEDFRTGQWTKHRIATGYKPKQAFLPGRGAPGLARAFFPSSSDKIPAILVSADDAGYVDLLRPIAGEKFAYSRTRVINSTNTVGAFDIADINGDGFADVAVPLFAENKVALFTFA